MSLQRRLIVLGALAALVATVAAACAPITVHSFVPRGANFAQYRSYGWEPESSFPTGDPRLDNNPFFQNRIKAQAESQLEKRGFERSTSATPDLLLHYHASVSQQLDIAVADQKYGVCEDCEPGSVFDAGTILLDMVDRRTNTLVWRGWAQTDLSRIDNQSAFEQRVDDTIARIVATVPSRSN